MAEDLSLKGSPGPPDAMVDMVSSPDESEYQSSINSYRRRRTPDLSQMDADERTPLIIPNHSDPEGGPVAAAVMDGTVGPRRKSDALNEYEYRWSLHRQASVEATSNMNEIQVQIAARTLGTFAGVFCPVALSMFSTLLFLRLGLVLGQAGFIQTLVMFFLAYLILYLTILSISAISTNGAIEGGGAYFMISRALGPEFGGSIGLLFYFAQVVSCAMYVSGFVEALMDNFGEGGFFIGSNMQGLPLSNSWKYLYGTVILAFCLLISLIGGHMYGKTNVFTLLILIICTLSVIISALVKKAMCVKYPAENSVHVLMNETVAEHYNCTRNDSSLYTGLNGQTFVNNVYDNYTYDYKNPSNGKMSFAQVFAILFSSVTGIMNGANMSGELKDPTKAIPKGTLAATSFTLGTYLILTILFACTSDRALLIGNYNFMISVNLWGEFVVIGIFAATLSAGLGNLIGGSRILLALAKDEIFWIFLKPATFTTAKGNPFASVLITWFLVQLVMLIGSLNAIAPMCSELFLLSYATTNLACLALDLSSAPNFRPHFRYFTSHTAFLGMVGSLIMCFVVSAPWAGGAIAVLIILLLVLHLRGFETSWGSISQALIFHQVRKYLLLLDSRKDHIKFWRPQMLLMVSNPRSCCQLIDFVNDLKKSGLYILGHVQVGSLDSEATDLILDEYPKWLNLVDRLKVKAFVELTLARSIREGMHHLIRVSGLGGMKPNTICFGFYDQSEPQDSFQNLPQSNNRRILLPFYNNESTENTELYKNFTFIRPNEGERGFGRVEYVQMIHDTLKLKKNVCLCRHFNHLNKKEISSKCQPMYIDVWPINFFQPESANHFDNTCLFVLQLACILHMVPSWKKKTKLRVFTCIEEQREERARKEKKLAEFMKLLRIRGEIRVVGWEHILHSLQRSLGDPDIGMVALASGVHEPGEPLPDDYMTGINDLIRSHCVSTSVVFLYLPPAPSSESTKQEVYLRKLDLLTKDLPPTVMVHGLQPVTCTSL